MKKILSLILVLFTFSLFYSCEDKAAVAKQKAELARQRKAEKRMKDSIRCEEMVVEHHRCTRLFGGLKFGMKKDAALQSYNKEYWNLDNDVFQLTFEGRFSFEHELGLKESVDKVYTILNSKDGINDITIESHKTTANHLDELQEDCLSILCYFLNIKQYELDREKYPELSILDLNDGEEKNFILDSPWPFFVVATIKQEYDTPLFSYRFNLSKLPCPVWGKDI